MKKQKMAIGGKICSFIVPFVLMTLSFAILAFADMPTTIDADSLKNQNDLLPKVTGYQAYTNHQGPAEGNTDNQSVYLDVYYDSGISIDSSDDVVKQLNISYGSTPLTDSTTVSIGEDGKTLHFEMKFPFAGYNGDLSLQSILDGNSTLSAVKKAGSNSLVNFPQIYLIVSNGIVLDTVSQKAGTSTQPASVTKKVNRLPSATRGAVRFFFLKNGQPVGGGTTNNLVSHFHMYLTLDAPTFATYIETAFNNLTVEGGIFKGYTAKSDGENLTITANAPNKGEVLDVITFAYPNDRNTYADKSELSAILEKVNAIALQNPDNTDLINEMAVAKSYVDGIYYTQAQVAKEAQRLQQVITPKEEDTATSPSEEDGTVPAPVASEIVNEVPAETDDTISQPLEKDAEVLKDAPATADSTFSTGWLLLVLFSGFSLITAAGYTKIRERL